MTPTIRRLNITQLEEIAEVFTAIFEKDPWNDNWADRVQLSLYLQDLIEPSNSLCLGLYSGKKLIGLCLGYVVHWWEGTEYHIQEFGILPDYQKKKAGSYFLKRIEEMAQEEGIRYLLLPTDRDTDAYQFYVRRGFSDMPGNVTMVKKIAPAHREGEES